VKSSRTDASLEEVRDEGLLTAPVAVPFLDLSTAHDALKDEILEDVARLIESNAFTNGPEVAAFERAFASYCQTPVCVGVGNGLDALRLGLLASGIEPRDEVIVPASTFVATFEAVAQAGGRLVVADVSEKDYNLDPEAAAAAIGSRTRFLLPVHLYGQMADMRSLGRLAKRHDLAVLEDACQAHGAIRDGLRAGSTGFAGAFSFYPGKNLGALGDAGALVTHDELLAARVRALREHGQTAKYRHDFEGYTSRLDTIQAAVLLRKLPFLDTWNEQRREAARLYGEALLGVGDLRLLPVPPGSEPVWHLYPVRTADPVRLADFLRARGIGTGFHYPEPPHRSEAYARLGYREGAFPVAERISREVVSLPLFPGMTEVQVEAVVDGVADFFRRG
jgi:dTDP-4-amino-4,6-dideoxygalactose transaminase